MEAGGLITALEAERRVWFWKIPACGALHRLRRPSMPGCNWCFRGVYGGPSSCRRRVAFRARIEGRVYASMASARPCSRAILSSHFVDLARSRQSGRRACDLAGRARYTAGQYARRKLREHDSGEGALLPVDYESKNLSSPVFSYPGPEAARRWIICTGMAARFSPRREAAICQSSHGPRPDADDRRFSATDARGIQIGNVSRDRFHNLLLHRRKRTEPNRRSGYELGRHDIFVVPSWYPVSHEPRARLCYSVSQIGRCNRLSACGASGDRGL